MAINEILGNINPMVHTEIACTQDGASISIPSQPPTVDFCYCDFECEYQEMVFASPGNESYKNDLSPLQLFELVDSGGVIDFKFYKEGVLIGSIIDDTYGTYTPVGGFPNTPTTDHSLKSGFIVDWEKVYNLLGSGKYHFEITITNFTRDVVVETQKYRLKLFSEKSANYSVVMKSTQNGYIQGGLDYTGLNWFYQYRIPGKLIYTVPEFEKTTNLLSSRKVSQVQAQVIRTFELTMDFIPSIISNSVINDNILANIIEVMDFNLWNQADLTYVFKSLEMEAINEVEPFDRSQNANYSFSFKEKIQDKVKRNFK